jgi:ankyrin repeat protein
MSELLREAIRRDDPQEVAALIEAGADIHYRDENGYDALIHSAYECDEHLLEMLSLLISHRVSLTGMSTYGESAVRVLSSRALFDAVKLLLDAGANAAELEFTPLMEAVAFGTPDDVEAICARGADLEERDRCDRTAWLIAVQSGDIAKAKILLEHGASGDVRDRCGRPPLFYTIENTALSTLRWLLDIGADIHATDDFGGTALCEAAQYGNLEAVSLLIDAGSDVNHMSRTGTALSHASTKEVIMRLLEAGADPQELSREGRRMIHGFPAEPDESLLNVSVKDFRKFWRRRFGSSNPQKMNNPFWEGMVRSGLNAYRAMVHVLGGRDDRTSPVWCADRFGQSITFLPDRRIVEVAGEHEDSSDPDFCIYNDVFVHDPTGGITIYGYPEAVFPPTDFHTATLIGNFIYLIGSLGYHGTRRFGETPVYRLDTSTFRIERLETTGDNPGWIYKHRVIQADAKEIQIAGGKIAMKVDGVEKHSDNAGAFTLDLENLVWSRLTG